MAYKISGNTNHAAKVYIIDETTDEIEVSSDVSSGDYSVGALASGTKTLIAKDSLGRTSSYSTVASIYDQGSLPVAKIRRGCISGDEKSNIQLITDFGVDDKTLIVHNGTFGASTSESNTYSCLQLTTRSGVDVVIGSKYVLGDTAPTLYDIIKFRDGVKIQRGTTELTATTVDTPIDTVDLSRTALLYTGSENTGAGRWGYSVLSDNSTVRSVTAHTANPPVKTSWAVLEFSADVVNSVQTNSVSLVGATDGTRTISSVDLNKSVIFFKFGPAGGASAGFYNSLGLVELTNSTTVTGKRMSTYSTTTYYFDVVEFADGIINSIQRGTTTMAGSSLININTIDLDKTVVITSGYYGDGEGSVYWHGAQLISSNELMLYASGSNSGSISWQVVEFV